MSVFLAHYLLVLRTYFNDMIMNFAEVVLNKKILTVFVGNQLWSLGVLHLN